MHCEIFIVLIEGVLLCLFRQVQREAMTTMHARKIILVSVALLILALLVSSAQAVSPAHRLSWNYAGESVDAGVVDPSLIVGSQIQTSGVMFQAGEDSMNWDGSGVFIDRTQHVTARLKVLDGGHLTDEHTGLLSWGDATVTIDGRKVGACRFGLEVLETSEGDPIHLVFYLFNMPGDPDGMSWFLTDYSGRYTYS